LLAYFVEQAPDSADNPTRYPELFHGEYTKD